MRDVNLDPSAMRLSQAQRVDIALCKIRYVEEGGTPESVTLDYLQTSTRQLC